MSEEHNLVVASKIKAYIKETAGLKCSATVTEELSKRVREMCDDAVENAKKAKRKTVKEKDF